MSNVPGLFAANATVTSVSVNDQVLPGSVVNSAVLTPDWSGSSALAGSPVGAVPVQVVAPVIEPSTSTAQLAQAMAAFAPSVPLSLGGVTAGPNSQPALSTSLTAEPQVAVGGGTSIAVPQIAISGGGPSPA